MMNLCKRLNIPKKLRIMFIIFAVLILLPVGWYYAIGPRQLVSSGVTSDLTIYYMGDVYQCVSAYPGDVERGRFVGYVSLFEDVYKVKNHENQLYKRSWQSRYLYEKVE